MTAASAAKGPRGPSSARTIAAWLALFVAAASIASGLARAWRSPLNFDDAFMFYRYALNLRRGFGLAWNAGGGPTYGLTSVPWVLFVLPMTALPLSPSHALELASFSTGVAALATLSFTVWRFAASSAGRTLPMAAAVVVLPLALNTDFLANATTGMDTMLSLLLNTLLVLGLLRYRERPSSARAWLAGLATFAAYLVRPDSGLCGLLAPALVWAGLGAGRKRADLLPLVAAPAALIALDLLACKIYFGTALPLSFYAKTGRPYVGYMGRTAEIARLFIFLNLTSAYVALACIGVRKTSAARLAAFVVPALLTCLYLTTVRQIMGSYGRFFLPLLPFVAVPCVLAFDDFVRASESEPIPLPAWRPLLGLLVMIAAGPASPAPPLLDALHERMRSRAPVAQPALARDAAAPLPETEWSDTVAAMGSVVSRLPKGSVIAASEVGYIGAVAPEVDVIDLVGLNDTRIGLQGFSMDYVLSLRPDLIWMPHGDYTGLRAVIFGDPRLYAQYDVLDGAFSYGLAIRKDSPDHALVEDGARAAWASLYPYVPMDGYLVRGIGAR
jgi:hypothetical protein